MVSSCLCDPLPWFFLKPNGLFNTVNLALFLNTKENLDTKKWYEARLVLVHVSINVVSLLETKQSEQLLMWHGLSTLVFKWEKWCYGVVDTLVLEDHNVCRSSSCSSARRRPVTLQRDEVQKTQVGIIPSHFQHHYFTNHHFFFF